MKVLNEALSTKDEIIQSWKSIEQLYASLRDECVVLASRCEKVPELSSSAKILETDMEELWEDKLNYMREDILDLYFPIDYGDNFEDIDAQNDAYDRSKYAREHAFGESLKEEVAADPVNDRNWDLKMLQDAIKVAEFLKANYVGKDRNKIIADCDSQIAKYKARIKDLKGTLKESVYSDIIGEPLKAVEQPALTVEEVEAEGPTPDNIGIANLIHDLIIDENEAIQGYNNAQANMESYPELVELMQDIASEELVHIGELQQALEKISPNASKIKEGEQEASEIISPETNNYESILSIDEIDDEF